MKRATHRTTERLRGIPSGSLVTIERMQNFSPVNERRPLGRTLYFIRSSRGVRRWAEAYMIEPRGA